MSTCKWPLGNGQTLEFTVYGSDTTWNKTAGLYVFTYQTPQGWIALYVGQTDDFSARLPNHERWNEAARLGATHVHAVVVPLQANRDLYEKMLIRNLQPRLNDQLR